MSAAAMTPDQARAAAERVMARCDELAALSETPDALTRVYLSPEHQRANALTGDWMREAGMTVWQDSVGNICGRYEGATPDASALLLGSHLDTVRDAGRYDGMLGVLTAIETVRHLHQQNRRLPLAVEVVGFGDEEGTRFGITLLGSRGLAGTWPGEWLEKEDEQGTRVVDALRDFGLDPHRLSDAARPLGEIAAYLELHIEQGPCLEQADLALGVVTAINGARRLNCTFTGQAGHAGTVPMGQRRDALAGAAEWMTEIERTTRAAGQDRVATVGALQCKPGAVNVIPGQARLSLDIRGPEEEPLEALLEDLLARAHAIAERRGLTFEADEFYRIAATACDTSLQQHLANAVTDVQGSAPHLPSGAGHDAIAMADHWPVAMLFVRCKGGISHHPAESVTTADVAQAIQAYTQAATDVATHSPRNP
ncbi:allantoate amidohydrolase [Alloalcanivorax sp. C16-2]|uniref:allantoate amidohydrolase n=1 Tax=Alloalcanivorax sp. C16-2 TaxID=3390052 RepID=UPI0039710619